jgi:hypothetical protein
MRLLLSLILLGASPLGAAALEDRVVLASHVAHVAIIEAQSKDALFFERCEYFRNAGEAHATDAAASGGMPGPSSSGFGIGRVTGGDGSSATSASKTTGTNAANANATGIAQAALKSPAGGPAPKAVGFAGISAQASQRVLSVVAKSLPAAPSGSQYGVWLTATGKPAVWLGYLQDVGSSGGVGLQGTLSGDPKSYEGVLLTLEKSSATPTNPSTTYLVGPLQFAAQ